MSRAPNLKPKEPEPDGGPAFARNFRGSSRAPAGRSRGTSVVARSTAMCLSARSACPAAARAPRAKPKAERVSRKTFRGAGSCLSFPGFFGAPEILGKI